MLYGTVRKPLLSTRYNPLKQCLFIHTMRAAQSLSNSCRFILQLYFSPIVEYHFLLQDIASTALFFFNNCPGKRFELLIEIYKLPVYIIDKSVFLGYRKKDTYAIDKRHIIIVIYRWHLAAIDFKSCVLPPAILEQAIFFRPYTFLRFSCI